ncbi:T-cell receptor alpha chain V region 2B4 [Fukomys damarensis]|nr:T-cell receptor alpha chain V region 2B4 [Fukomys damarensis]
MQVEQSPPALVLQEGANSTLSCSFSDSVTTVQWFRQDPGGRLVNLFYIPSGTKQNGRLEATTVPKERHSSLHISFSQPTDSATYFCAATHTAPQAPAAATQTLSQEHMKGPLQRPFHSLVLLIYIGGAEPKDNSVPHRCKTLWSLTPLPLKHNFPTSNW